MRYRSKILDMFVSYGYKQDIMKSNNSEMVGVEPGWIIMEWLTRVSTKIRTKEDEELLQQDLNTVYRWADENLM